MARKIYVRRELLQRPPNLLSQAPIDQQRAKPRVILAMTLLLSPGNSIAILRSETVKLNNFWATSLALALALGFPQVSALQAQTQSQVPNNPQDQQDEQNQLKSQTFRGKIVKASSGQYALLIDELAGQGVYLDDQEKAKEFEGKHVKVTGVLEAAKNLLHVANIEP